MSKPNGWNFTIRSMAKQVKDGEDGIRSGLRELRQMGCIVYVKHQNGTGTYHLKTVINSYEKPKREKPVKAVQSQNGETPGRENPLKGKSTRISNKEALVINIKDSNKETTRSFTQFWLGYPKKRKKQESLKVWKAKKLHKIADLIIADVNTRINKDQRWIDGYVPDPTTYLRNARWEDEVEEKVINSKGPTYGEMLKVARLEKERQSGLGQLVNNTRGE
jgi:hypothetical protein